MASTIQLSELRTEVRRRGEYRAPFISDAELNGYINASLQHLYDKIAHIDPSRYLTTGTVSVVNGTESYALPATFYKMIAVLIPSSSSPTGYVLADRIRWQERHMYNSPVTSHQEKSLYAIRGGNIYFWPTPTWTATVNIDFIPTFTKLTLDSSTFDGINGFEEWAIADVLIKCAAKAEDADESWVIQRGEAEKRMFESGDQDQARPKRVVNVHNFFGRRGVRRSFGHFVS